MNTEKTRVCPLCDTVGVQSDMMMIRGNRFETLKKWYPEDLRSETDWVHKNCLAHLGLYTLPRGRIKFERVIGARVLKRIQDIIT